jgi:hypothetical protein
LLFFKCSPTALSENPILSLTLSLIFLFNPQSCGFEAAKFDAAGTRYFLARGSAERNSQANQIPRPQPDILVRPL